MAVVAFTALWISPADDPSLGVGFRCQSITATPQRGQRIGQYGTRRRAVSTSVKAQQIAAVIYCDTRDQVDFLTDQQGEDVVYRDRMGRKFYATYDDPNIPEQNSPNVRLQVSVTFNEITSQYGAPV